MTKNKKIFKIFFTSFTCLWLLLIVIFVPRIMPILGTIYDNFPLTQSHFLQMAQEHTKISHGFYLLVLGTIAVCLIIIHRRSEKLWPSVTANTIVIFISIVYLIISVFIISLPLIEYTNVVIEKNKSEQVNTADRQAQPASR